MPASRLNLAKWVWKHASHRHGASPTLLAKAKAATRRRLASWPAPGHRAPIRRLADIEEAFSVEAVTKEFFTKYARALRRDSQGAGEADRKGQSDPRKSSTRRASTPSTSPRSSWARSSSSISFRRRAGSVSRRDKIGELARTTSCDNWRNGEHGKYDNFFNDVLEPLFYDTLATDRGHEAWCNRFKCRIPFLNGGLFEPLG